MLNGFSQRYLLKENSCSNWFDIPETKSVAFTVLPYVHGIGKKIQRMFNELDIKVALKQWFSTCGTRTTSGTRSYFWWYARHLFNC